MSKNGSSFGKWVAGIAAAVIGSVLVWWLTQSGNVLNRERPQPTPPHAPALDQSYGGALYDEQLKVVTVEPGAKVTLDMRELWSAPEGIEADCATGFVAFSWIVRSPYPEGGEDLELRQLVPMGGGRTSVLAQGSTGSASIGYCDELTLYNTALEEYQIEIMYASGAVGVY